MLHAIESRHACRRASLGRRDRCLVAFLGLAFAGLYGHTMDRSYGGGDAGEVQLAAEHLGICHPPGYALQTLLGHAFTRLPIGGIPWRVNLLSVLSAAVTVAALLAALRIAGVRPSAAVAACAALGLSDLFWCHARYSEVYAFHAALVALAVLAAAKYAASPQRRWLALECLALGAACSARPSELLLLPAFAAFHLAHRLPRPTADDPVDRPQGATTPTTNATAARPTPRTVTAIAATCFLLPYLLTFGYLLWRDRPDTRINTLNDYARNQQYEPAAPRIPADNATLAGRARRAAWTMSLAPFHRYVSPAGHAIGPGMTYYAKRLAASDFSLGGVALIAAGLTWRRTPRPLACLGVGLWAGNLATYLTFGSIDRITFTLPGLLGLTLLAGGGAERLLRLAPARLAPAAAAAMFLPAGWLLAHNYEINDASNPDRLSARRAALEPDPLALLEPARLRQRVVGILPLLRSGGLPPNAAILTPFHSGRTLQCALAYDGGPHDVEIIIMDPSGWRAFGAAHHGERPIFMLTSQGLAPLDARREPTAPPQGYHATSSDSSPRDARH